MCCKRTALYINISVSIYRWLDESDGVNGIEQELILSDIMVADEDDKEEDLPGKFSVTVTVLKFITIFSFCSLIN